MDNMSGLRQRLCDYREELTKIMEAIDNLEDDIAEEILLIDLKNRDAQKRFKKLAKKNQTV